jgi:ATP-dependent protease ClpP protease subunit
MKSWFKMQMKAGKEKTAEIMIYEEIGYWGKTAKDFKCELDALGEVDNIDLRICSPGGNVFMGFAIYNLLCQHSAKIVAYIDGIAASMASIIPMAAEEIKIASNGYMMIHNPWGGAFGESKDMRRLADLLDGMKENAVKAYQKHCNLSKEEIIQKMDSETFFNADESIEAGFAHEIYDAVEIAASIDTERYPNLPKNIFNQTKPNQTEESMNEKEYQDKIAALEAKNQELESKPKLKDFQALAEKEGFEFAKANFGKNEAEIAKAKADAEIAQLKADKEELEKKLKAKGNGAQGAAFSDGSQGQKQPPAQDEETFMDKVNALVKEEKMTQTEAVLKTAEEFPELHAKFVGKEYK